MPIGATTVVAATAGWRARGSFSLPLAAAPKLGCRPPTLNDRSGDEWMLDGIGGVAPSGDAMYGTGVEAGRSTAP